MYAILIYNMCIVILYQVDNANAANGLFSIQRVRLYPQYY